MRKKKKLLITAVVVVAAVFIAWRMFFPDLFVGSVPADTVSKGTTSISDDSNILIAYFSLTGNRNYQSDVDAVSSASLTNHDGKILGNAAAMYPPSRWRAGAELAARDMSSQ